MFLFIKCITNKELLITRTPKFHWTHLLLGIEPKSETCIICEDGFGDDSTANIVYEKGLETLIRFSKEKDTTELIKCLLELKNSNQEDRVHHSCRQKFTDKRKMSLKQTPTKKLGWSLEVRFDCTVHCFLCRKSIDFYNKHSYSEVMTLQLRESLIERGNERNNEWEEDIVCRLESCNDLVAEEAKYHINCMTKFRLKDATEKSRGRTEDMQMVKDFERVCIFVWKKHLIAKCTQSKKFI